MLSINIQGNAEQKPQFGNIGQQKNTNKTNFKNGTLFAGDSNLSQEDQAMKKVKAGKDAMKGVLSQFGRDREVDSTIEEKEQNTQKFQKQTEDLRDQLSLLDEAKENLNINVSAH